MRYALCLVVAVVVPGCGGALPEGARVVCAWHFLQPDDTSDTNLTPDGATCDASAFVLHDGKLALTIHADGTVDGCVVRARIVSADDAHWSAELDGCGAAGTITANLD